MLEALAEGDEKVHNLADFGQVRQALPELLCLSLFPIHGRGVFLAAEDGRGWWWGQQLPRHEVGEVGCLVLEGAPDGDFTQLVQHDIPVLKLQPLLLEEVHAVLGLSWSQQLLAILTFLPASFFVQRIWREASLDTLTS